MNYWFSGRKDLPFPHSTRGHSWEETTIEGCKEIVEYIVGNQDTIKSVLLWNCLLKIIETKCNTWQYRSLSSLLRGICSYFFYSSHNEYFISSDAILLKQSKWLVNADGEFVLPESLNRATLPDMYDTISVYAQDLLNFLSIAEEEDEPEEEEDDTFLTDSQREKIEFANKLKVLGIDESDLEEFQEFKRQKEASKRASEQAQGAGHEEASDSGDDDDFYDIFDDEPDDDADADKGTLSAPHEKCKINKTTSDVFKDIVRRTKEVPSAAANNDIGDDDDADQDELMPSAVDYSKKIERAKQESASEIDRIAYFEELQNKVLNAEKYSFAWFIALLEMESFNSREVNSNSKEVSISFAKVEREPGTKRTLVLKYPNRYIPRFMEDLADIPLVLHIGDQTKTVAIEVVNIKSYTLRVKLKNSADIDAIDLTTVTAGTIDAKSPAFLLEELRKQFADLEYDDDFDMQENLCENIEFVFGPPGTGKTTHLAKKCSPSTYGRE